MLPQRTVPETTRTPCEEATISPSVNSATEAPIIVLTKRGFLACGPASEITRVL